MATFPKEQNIIQYKQNLIEENVKISYNTYLSLKIRKNNIGVESMVITILLTLYLVSLGISFIAIEKKLLKMILKNNRQILQK